MTQVWGRDSVYAYVHKHSINMIIRSCIIVVLELQKNQSPFTHSPQAKSPKSITHWKHGI